MSFNMSEFDFNKIKQIYKKKLNIKSKTKVTVTVKSVIKKIYIRINKNKIS